MNRQTLNLGVFGFGCVGQGLYDVLHQTQGIKAEIKRICVKDRNKERRLPEAYFTFDKNDILNDPNINIVVELIDDADAAYEIVTAAMKNGKGVVTANKKMMAEHFEELFNLQHECGVPLLYEGAACASIPIIRNLAEYYDNDLLSGIEGIFNGSSNYILSKVCRDGVAYNEALKEAQDLGFAETDPTLDVGGFDPKYKLLILTAHAFGVFLQPENIFNCGIQTLNEHDMKFLSEKGWRIKLMATAKKIGNKLCTYVLPQMMSHQHKLWHVEDEYNGVIVEAAFSDQQFFVGKGAGSFPTGSAVLSDISALTYNYKYEYKKYHQQLDIKHTNDFLVEIYLRYYDKKVLDDVHFVSVEESFRSKQHNYIIGKVNWGELMCSPIVQNPDVFISQTINETIEVVKEKETASKAILEMA
ncbi:MAG: homoserine dehydrogenase [Flavobacteriales bacterium]|nr:MAG: homoserine dehydrogenase [Flavobacteriales bacterium]